MAKDFTVTRPSPKWVLNKDSVLVQFADNFPSFEFNPDGSYKGLLVERQSTNLCKQSEDINTTWSAINATPTQSTETTPDGDSTNKYIKLVDDGDGGTGLVRVIQAITVSAGTKYTASVFLKATDPAGLTGLAFARLVAIGVNGNTDSYQFFGLSGDGSLGAAFNLDDSSITKYPDGWYRCSITWTQGAADTSFSFVIYVADSISSVTVDLDGTSSIYVWGAQVEEGDKATSYIPTTTTETVTRAADYIYLNNASQYLPSSGTVVIKADFGESYDLNILGLTTTLSGEKEVKFTYSDTEIELFVDGQSIQSKTGTYDFSGMDIIEIGNFDSGSEFNRHLQYFAIQ